MNPWGLLLLMWIRNEQMLSFGIQKPGVKQRFYESRSLDRDFLNYLIEIFQYEIIAQND